jgi:hypothetical protein
MLVLEGMLGRGGAGGAGRGGGGAAGAGLGAGAAAGFAGAAAGFGAGAGAGAAALGLGFGFAAFLAGAAFLAALFFAAGRFALRATAFFAFLAFFAFFAFVFDFAFFAMIVPPIVAAQIRYGAHALRRQGATGPIRTLSLARSTDRDGVALMRCPATPRACARRSSNRSARPYGLPEWPSPLRSA